MSWMLKYEGTHLGVCTRQDSRNLSSPRVTTSQRTKKLRIANTMDKFLNSMRVTDISPHRPVKKPGCRLTMMRNLNKRSGLCNDTLLIFEGMSDVYLRKCQIASGEYTGGDVLIPRILTQLSDFRGHPCGWCRQQF